MWDDLIGENLTANPVDQTRNLIDRIGIGSVPWDAQSQDLSGVIGSNADYQNKIANASVPAAAGNAFVVSPADRILNSVKSIDWNDDSWRGQHATSGGADFGQSPPPMPQYAPANALPLPDQSQYQSLGIGLTPEQSRDAMNATGFGTARASAAAEADRGGAWGGIQGNPYFMGIRPQATNVLGYQGSFMGGSRGYTDDSAGQAWDQAANRNVEIQRMLGNQNIARQSNANEMARLGIASADRQEAIQQRREASFWNNYRNLPEGKRLPFLQAGLASGSLNKDVGEHMIIPELIKGAAMSPGVMKEGKVSDLPKFIGSLHQQFDPKIMDKANLIQGLQGMGIDPNDLKKMANDPVYGQFVQSLLGPEVTVLKPLSRAIRNIQDVIYGSGSAAPEPQPPVPAGPQSQPSGAFGWLQSLLY